MDNGYLPTNEYRILRAKVAASIAAGLLRRSDGDTWGKHQNIELAEWACDIASHILDECDLSDDSWKDE